MGMAKLQIKLDGQLLRECALTRGRITIGRRKHCDIQLEHPTVSGDHAVIERSGRHVYLEDRDSTNGTRLNGKRIGKRQKLQSGDAIGIAPFTLHYLDDQAGAQPGFEHTLMMTEIGSGGGVVDTRPVVTSAQPQVMTGCLRVLNGASAGREIWLGKPLTTLGKTGVEVACIERQPQGYTLRHVEGVRSPRVNSREIGQRAHDLVQGDLIDFMGVQMRFTLEQAAGGD